MKKLNVSVFASLARKKCREHEMAQREESNLIMSRSATIGGTKGLYGWDGGFLRSWLWLGGSYRYRAYRARGQLLPTAAMSKDFGTREVGYLGDNVC